jgi:hypothetical protein
MAHAGLELCHHGTRNVPTESCSRGGSHVCASGYRSLVDDEKYRLAVKRWEAPKKTRWDRFYERFASLPFVPMILPPHDSASSPILFLMFEKTPSERHQNVISLQWLPFATRHPVFRSLGEGGWQLVTRFSTSFPPHFCPKIK